MAWQIDGGVNVVVHGTRSPTDLEWATYLNETGEASLRPDFCLLVLSRGGSPDGKQRTLLTSSIPKGARKPPVALLTDSAGAANPPSPSSPTAPSSAASASSTPR
jgi:hypothetical protein